MAVGLKALTEDTTTILTSVYDDLIRQSEQLRILKNCINKDLLLCDIKNVLKAMDDNATIEIIAANQVQLEEDLNNE